MTDPKPNPPAFAPVLTASKRADLRAALQAAAAAAAVLLAPAARAQAQAAPEASDLAACVATLKRGAAAEGVRPESYDRLTQGLQDLRPVIEKFAQSQPEFKLALWDYITRRVDAERVADGKRLMAEQAGALERITARHAVDGATAVAVFGIETDFGRVRGRYPVIDATASRACLRLDNAERRRHFHAALWLAQEGHVKVEEFTGSWAGAFGMTQFMPATFRAYMDDGDGSGTIDIVNSVADALGTTARYLKALRWNPALPWGVEVRPTPALAQQAAVASGDVACLGSGAADGAGRCRSAEQWAAAGLRRADGGALLGSEARPGLPAQTQAALFMPTGPNGPAWLITQNYRAIWQYNRADAYALSIGLLADRLRDEPPPRTPWPTDDPGISRAEFRELQTLLAARGACDVNPDGRDGPRTSAAISAFEREQGWPETGRGGLKVLRALRAAAAGPSTAAACGTASAPR